MDATSRGRPLRDTTPVTGQIQRQAVKGVAWMLAFKVVDRSLGLVSTLILVRLLTPADFGIIAIAMAFIAMAELVAGFGFDIALIQNRHATDAHFNTAWTCNVFLGLAIAAIMIAAATPISIFYGRNELFVVVCALGAGPAIGGFENSGIATFRKDMNFAREFLFLFSKRALAFAVTIPLAFWFRDYTALVAGMLVSRMVGVVLSYLLHPFRPRISISKIGEMFRFSKWNLMNNLILFARERSTDIVVGRLHGPAALGIFNISNELSNLPLTELSAPINRALIPAFARLQDDLPAVRSAFVSTIGLLALLALPAALGIAAIAPLLVPVVLGPSWLDAVPLMEVLAFSGGLVAFQSPVCAILIGCGWPDLVFRCHVVFVVSLLIALFGFSLGVGIDVKAAALAMLAAALVSTPVFFWQLARKTGISLLAIGASVVRPLLAATLMWAAVRFLMAAPNASDEMLRSFALLGIGIVLGAIVYAISLAALWSIMGRPAGAELLVIEQLRDRLIRLRNR